MIFADIRALANVKREGESLAALPTLAARTQDVTRLPHTSFARCGETLDGSLISMLDLRLGVILILDVTLV